MNPTYKFASRSDRHPRRQYFRYASTASNCKASDNPPTARPRVGSDATRPRWDSRSRDLSKFRILPIQQRLGSRRSCSSAACEIETQSFCRSRAASPALANDTDHPTVCSSSWFISRSNAGRETSRSVWVRASSDFTRPTISVIHAGSPSLELRGNNRSRSLLDRRFLEANSCTRDLFVQSPGSTSHKGTTRSDVPRQRL